MDKRYEVYCLMDPLFYDAPARPGGGDTAFPQALRPAPDGWRRTEVDDWLALRPAGRTLPVQGWKIHVSACLDNAADILTTVWEYCVPRRIAFKFLPDRDTLLLANAKYAHRGSSGKFVTVYPADEAELERVLTELGALLDGRAGPYILSDLRWGEGPLYVRYGAFAERYCVSEAGEVEPAVEDGEGRLVPDVRGPAFQVPDWVELPGFLAPHLARRGGGAALADLPYRFESALHFSNGGGIYAGTDLRTGDHVVLKEARPHAGLTPDGRDAVARQRREREMLERLRGLDCVPALHDHFEQGGHHFLVEERIEGTELNDLFVDRYPLTLARADEAATAGYASWALDVHDRVARAVGEVHARGVVLGDLQPSNIIVRPDGSVVLIDLEGAADEAEGRRQALGAQGFTAPRALRGTAVDDYALACLKLFLFLPLTGLLTLAPGKAAQLAREAARTFPVPDGYFDEAVRLLTGAGGTAGGAEPGPRLRPDRTGWAQARAALARSVLAAATPERDDRLFPGDIEQFATPGGGLGMANGAAGVLYALDVTGAGRHPGHEEWLIRRALRPQPGTLLGLYDGLHGVAHVLDHLGHRQEALKILDQCAGEQWHRLGPDLRGGLSGIGLNLLHFATATGEPALRDAAAEAVDAVAARLGPADAVPEVSGGGHPYAGLMRGSSGPALLFLRWYEHTGDPEFLDLAATALRQDLRRCLLRDEDGVMEVDEGWRTMPYLAEGSVGIGLVLDDYLAHRANEGFTAAAAAIRRAAEGRFYVEPGLFHGLAGMILHLSRAHPAGTAAQRDPVVGDQIRRLARYAVGHAGGLAFPGEELLRLSLDLATGSAGVLLALGAALHDSPVRLPFLAPPPAGRAGPPSHSVPVPMEKSTEVKRHDDP